MKKIKQVNDSNGEESNAQNKKNNIECWPSKATKFNYVSKNYANVHNVPLCPPTI